MFALYCTSDTKQLHEPSPALCESRTLAVEVLATMSTRRSRPPRGRKSRNPEAPPNEVPVIIPPVARGAMKELSAQPRSDTSSDELAAIEAGWDELLA
jgi:hypothetical protein